MTLKNREEKRAAGSSANRRLPLKQEGIDEKRRGRRGSGSDGWARFRGAQGSQGYSHVKGVGIAQKGYQKIVCSK